MTKKDIVRKIADETGLPQLKVKEVVQKTFDAIVDTLVENGNIELRNFGVFRVRVRKSRKAINPRTGVRVWVDERRGVSFKPGKEMEERIQKTEKSKVNPNNKPKDKPSHNK